MVELWHSGVTARKIARRLKCNEKTVRNAVARFASTKSIEDRPRSGRPSKLTSPIKRRIGNWALRPGGGTVRRIKQQMEKRGVKLGIGTVHKALVQLGFEAKNPVPKPLLTEDHCARRMAFATDHLNDSKYKIRKVVYSDEKYFVANGFTRKVWVRPGDQPPVRPTRNGR
jgi:transposase